MIDHTIVIYTGREGSTEYTFLRLGINVGINWKQSPIRRTSCTYTERPLKMR